MQDLSQHPAMNRCQPCIKQPAAQSIASCLQSSDLVALLKSIKASHYFAIGSLLLLVFCLALRQLDKGPIVLPGGLGGVLQPTTKDFGAGLRKMS